jgi:23S rRNA (pseudouridine1915-N3)-methyltransferase
MTVESSGQERENPRMFDLIENSPKTGDNPTASAFPQFAELLKVAGPPVQGPWPPYQEPRRNPDADSMPTAVPDTGQENHQALMKLWVVAVGKRMPDWAQTACDDYVKRFGPDLRLEVITVKTEPRRSKTRETLLAAERQRIEAAIPLGARVVAMDERGSTYTSQALAQQLTQWQSLGDDVAFVIGGPDGLCPEFRAAASARIRLSDMTLPHAMARVLLVEQLYRAWSILTHHPYHRE